MTQNSDKNDLIRAAISSLNQDELRIAVAKSQGIEIVCEKWPCEYGIDGTGIDAAIDVCAGEDGLWYPVDGLESFREFDLRYPVTRGYSAGWPPKKSTISFAEDNWVEAHVEPIPNVSDDILAAMFLVSDLKHQGEPTDFGRWDEGFRFNIGDSANAGMHKCAFSRDTPTEIMETGEAPYVAEAICKAYLMIMLIHLNPQICDKILDLEGLYNDYCQTTGRNPSDGD